MIDKNVEKIIIILGKYCHYRRIYSTWNLDQTRLYRQLISSRPDFPSAAEQLEQWLTKKW